MIPILRDTPYRWFIDGLLLLVLSPFAWWVSDRQPPWTRVWGEIEATHAGEAFSVRWHTTPNQRDCPGIVQVEIFSGPLIWPVMRRAVGTNIAVGQTEYVTPPWPLDSEVPVGTATYRVTTFWYCNWIHVHLNWPIVQVGPDINFKVLPYRKSNSVVPGEGGRSDGARGERGERGEQGPPGEQGIQGEPGK
jgi:hypothetical protein